MAEGFEGWAIYLLCRRLCIPVNIFRFDGSGCSVFGGEEWECSGWPVSWVMCSTAELTVQYVCVCVRVLQVDPTGEVKADNKPFGE